MSRCGKGFLILLLVILYCERKEYLNPYDPINLPPAPYLQEPQDDSTSVDNPPHFHWDVSEDTLNPFYGEPLIYELRVDTTDEFSDTVYNITNHLWSSLSPEHLFGDNTYYWQTRARYIDGGWSEWSPAWKFDVLFPLVASCAVTATGDMVSANDRIYMATNGDLAIINISNPHTPYLVQTYHDSALAFNHLFISGQYLYVTHTGYYGSISVYNLENPDQPVLTNSLTLHIPGDFWIDNDRAYVLCDHIPIVIDITDSDSLIIVDTLPGYGNHIVVDNDYAYVGGNGIYIIDLQSGNTVATLSTYTNKLHINEHYLFVASNPTMIYDIISPANPVQVNCIEKIAYHIITAGDYLFLGFNSMYIYDISTMNDPVYIGKTRFLEGPFCIHGTLLSSGYPEYSVIKYE
ncbi:MAG: hypothetical protein JSW02_06210 [candidate division WOR-3 bacterium]|nr:MAG: hypothetical protein JSW02_06210 [candidate division WOR-3 bacterium]